MKLTHCACDISLLIPVWIKNVFKVYLLLLFQITNCTNVFISQVPYINLEEGRLYIRGSC